MAQNLIIANATYSDVPAVDISKVGGGTARFVDTSDANATASDIASGKTAYVNGIKVTGTGSGGSGGQYNITSTINQDDTQDLSITDATGATIIDSLTVTENGTYTASAGHAYSPVVVNVSGGDTYAYSGQGSSTSTSMKNTNVTIEDLPAGTYNISYCGSRSSSSNSSAQVQLYINNSAYGSATTISSYFQVISLSNVTLSATSTISVYAKSRSSSYTTYAGNLIAKKV